MSSKIFENDLLTQRRKREKMSQNNAKIKITVDGMNTYGSTYGEKLLYSLKYDVI